MNAQHPPRPRSFGLGNRGTISVIFALLMVPLTLIAALAIDYAFYIQARAQLNLAADAAAMHAVRVASQAYGNGYTTVASEQAAGQAAGTQWFAAQLGSLAAATGATPTVTVTYQSAPSTFASSVSYTAALPTNFGNLVPASWPISGSSSSTVQSGYLEVLFLVDNSSSMLIAADTPSMLTMEQNTPCSPAASATILPGSIGTMDTGFYDWKYTGGYGYPNASNYTSDGLLYYTGTSTLDNFTTSNYATTYKNPTATVNGACNTSYDGPASLCFYMPTSVVRPTTTTLAISTSTGKCTASSGTPGGSNTSDSPEPTYTPQSPCAFACHWSSTNNDYYGLAKSLNVTLRLDVAHTAMATAITALQSSQQMANQYTVGYYEFNSALTNVYPGSGEAGASLATALTDVQNLTPPITSFTNFYNTDFTNAMTTLNASVTAAGNGLSPTTPMKTLIILTDGMNDTAPASSYAAQTAAAMTSTTHETLCQNFKNKGFNVYVLYTYYLPFPNTMYSVVKPLIEPAGSSPIELALQACSSGSSFYYPASNAADITTAVNSIIQSVMATPGRISH